jgi:hypothetical protein
MSSNTFYLITGYLIITGFIVITFIFWLKYKKINGAKYFSFGRKSENNKIVEKIKIELLKQKIEQKLKHKNRLFNFILFLNLCALVITIIDITYAMNNTNDFEIVKYGFGHLCLEICLTITNLYFYDKLSKEIEKDLSFESASL